VLLNFHPINVPKNPLNGSNPPFLSPVAKVVKTFPPYQKTTLLMIFEFFSEIFLASRAEKIAKARVELLYNSKICHVIKAFGKFMAPHTEYRTKKG
jgi:hypothetical protein